METLPKKYILETAEACREYTEHLNVNLKNAETHLHNVHTSAELARQQVEQTFQCLIDDINANLNQRKQFLLDKIKKFEMEAEAPLVQCKTEIAKMNDASEALLQESDNIIRSGGFASQNIYQSFMEKNAKLGSLPAVPDKECVPNITFQGPPEDFMKDFLESLSSLGEISKIGPVQITSIEALPGSLMITWDEIESEAEVHSYRLQMGDQVSIDVTKDDTLFKDIFTGNERSFIARDLKARVDYVFRVCCRMSERSEWSAWSYVKKGRTEVRSYTWDQSNSKSIVTDEGKMARMLQSSVLYSDGPQIRSGHSFQVSLANYNQAKASDEEGIAVCGENSFQTLQQRGVLFVTFHGKIFVDGHKNRTQLPSLRNGEKVTWDCHMLKNGKWRITIEVCERCVTYDWTPQPAAAQLYFSAVLCQPEAHILLH